MSLTALPQSPRPTPSPDEPRTAGLVREMTEQGGVLYKMIMDAIEQSDQGKNVEHLAVSPLNRTYSQGDPSEVSPTLPDGSLDMDVLDIINDPNQSLATGHNHPSEQSISPEDLNAWTLYSTLSKDPAAQWIFKPENYKDPLRGEKMILDDFEGVRIKDDELRYTPDEIGQLNRQTADPQLIRSLNSSPLYDLIRDPEGMARPQYDMEGTELLEEFAPDRDFQRLPLMYLGQKDVIDYYTPPSEGMDELLKIYTNLLENQ